LGEEFNEEQVTPEPTQFERLSGVRNVRQMEHEFDQKLFVLGVLWIEIFIAHSAAQMSKFNEMLTHVCG